MLFTQNLNLWFLATLLLLLAPYQNKACNSTQDVDFTSVSNNGDGTYNVVMDVLIGDGGSLSGISTSINGLNIIAFSPASLTHGMNTATGFITNGNLHYFDSSSPVFVDFYLNPIFEITITVDSDPVGLVATFTGLNATTTEVPGSCNFTDSSWDFPINDPLAVNTLTCGDVFTDTGGTTGNYSNEEYYTTIICPDLPSTAVEVDFLSFDLENGFDFMTMYDADAATGASIVFTGTNSPGKVASTNPSGCLTFVFASEVSVSLPGWEANISCVPPPILRIEMRIFLEGPYENGVMNPCLSNLLPLTEPYTDLGYARGSVVGGEATDGTSVSNMVDWLLLELRDPANPEVILTSKAVILKGDGQVVDVYNNDIIEFDVSSTELSSFLPVVRHRNHLSTVYNQNCSSNCLLDFTSADLTGQKDLGNGVFGLITGSANGDDVIDASDRSATWNARNQGAYQLEDVNLDCSVDAADRSIIWNNRNTSVTVP